jgi:hypothetical protein
MSQPRRPTAEFSHGTSAGHDHRAGVFDRREVLASGDANGAVGIWKVGGRGRVFGADNSPIKLSGSSPSSVSTRPMRPALTAAGTSAIV